MNKARAKESELKEKKKELQPVQKVFTKGIGKFINPALKKEARYVTITGLSLPEEVPVSHSIVVSACTLRVSHFSRKLDSVASSDEPVRKKNKSNSYKFNDFSSW